MPLSIQKLEDMLLSKGYIPKKYYTYKSYCTYIEIMSVQDSVLFLLYIPSNYNFKIKTGDNVYKLNYINIENENGNITDDFAGQPDEHEVENTYKDVEGQFSPETKDGNIAKFLEERYKREITLKNMKENDIKELKDIFRQLKRLGFCVQNLKYKLCISYKNFLCCIKRDDSIEYYSIKEFKGDDNKQLFISVDLELFYDKIESLIINMETIKKGIYHILDKNHLNHTETLSKMIEEKTDIMNFSQNAYQKKQEYESLINESKKMLKSIIDKESEISQIIENINSNNENTQNITSDIEKIHIVSQHKKQLEEINKLKQDIIKTILQIQTKRDNVSLTVDKIMFDNSVMLDAILRNFLSLAKINF